MSATVQELVIVYTGVEAEVAADCIRNDVPLPFPATTGLDPLDYVVRSVRRRGRKRLLVTLTRRAEAG